MNYKMHCVLKITCIKVVKMRKSVKMKVSYKMQYVLECINNKVVPEIHFAALLKLEAPVESTLELNPWCFGAGGVYVHTCPPPPPHTHSTV
jgi:hypothetical protein